MKNFLLAAKSVKTANKSVSILAYAGGIMVVPGWGPLALDLSGIDVSGQIKLLVDHDSSLKGLVGHGAARAMGSKLFVEGSILVSQTAGKALIELSKEGIELQASVGVSVKESKYIQAGDKIQLNGATLKSDKGFTLIKKGSLREVSLCLLGCDENTAVKIAASISNTRSSTMGISKDKIQEIRACCEKFKKVIPVDELHKIEASAIDDEMEQTQVFQACMNSMELSSFKAGLQESPNANIKPHNFHVPGTSSSDVLAAGVLMMQGLDATAEKNYDERTLQAASDLRLSCALDVCNKSLQMSSQAVPTSRTEMIKAAFSTTGLSNALANSATKELLTAYELVAASWKSIGLVKPTKNFHPHSAIRGVLKDGLYVPVAPGGELKHANLDDDSMTYQSNTKGRMFGVDRKVIINDDLGAIFDLMRVLGLNGARTINKTFWETVIAGTNFFKAENNNYQTGSVTVLSVDGLSVAIKALREQKDGADNPIGVVPTVLAVPPALESIARQLLASIELNRTGDNDPLANPWKNLNLKLEVEPFLGASAGGDDDAWYLFGNKHVAPAVIVSFLHGKQNPTVETDAAPFNMLGQQFRAYHDFGCDLGDPHGGQKMSGQA